MADSRLPLSTITRSKSRGLVFSRLERHAANKAARSRAGMISVPWRAEPPQCEHYPPPASTA